MAAIPATKFLQFARQCATYVQSGQFTPLLKKELPGFRREFDIIL